MIFMKKTEKQRKKKGGMPKQKKNDLEKKSQKSFFQLFIPQNKRVQMILTLLVALFLALASFSLAGKVGAFVHERIISFFFGMTAFVVPLLLLFFVWKLNLEEKIEKRDFFASFFVLISLSFIFSLAFQKTEIMRGGLIGKELVRFFVSNFDVYFSWILALGIFLASLVALLDPHFAFYKKIKETREKEKLERAKKEEIEKNYEEQVSEALKRHKKETEEREEVGNGSESLSIKNPLKEIVKKKKKDEKKQETILMEENSIFASPYTPPPLKLLGTSSGRPTTGDIKANANLIQRTLMNFGIDVEMDEISIGPTVTRYAIKPAQGVRLSRIANLQNELALALAAKSIRIEAPIPGRSLVGIEVPNKSSASIGLGSLLKEDEYTRSDKPLLISLGKGVSGKSYFANLAKMPHALIAGATGSGKSVTIHNIVLSLLYKNGPDILRFIMVDPKRVEMTLYKKIPHLLTPVITDPKKAVLALKWAVKEMERRYDVLQSQAVRDIDSYHKSIVAPAYQGLSPEEIEEQALDLPEKMPYIVVIIDELSDIMSAYPREMEAAIVRLAQMSRAVGIHLILATQRPSVNVITGLIKANIPTRMALKVTSQIDSRTILDARGAEKLLGKGDMLYKGEGFNEAIRVQCPFVSEEEVKSVVKYLQKNYRYALDDEIIIPDEQIEDSLGGFETSSDEKQSDPLYEEARQIVVMAGKASTSYLQRRLAIGYSRAAKIIDLLEKNGVIGPANGSKPREVFEKAEHQDNLEEEHAEHAA